jgi:hypothetical protein
MAWVGVGLPASAGLALSVLGVAGCTPTMHTIEPYRSDAAAAREVEESADRACPRPASDRPPHRFTTDGCSMFPDDGWVGCCVEHDFDYWCGGSSDDRTRADERLRQCVAEKKSAALGWLMWAGVRVGGIPWSPFPWRWAYGWDCWRGYDSR